MKLTYNCITDSDFTDSDFDNLFGTEFNSQYNQPSATKIALRHTNSGDVFLSENKLVEALEEYKKAFAVLEQIQISTVQSTTSVAFKKKNAKPHRLAQTTTRTQPIRIEFKNGL